MTRTKPSPLIYLMPGVIVVTAFFILSGCGKKSPVDAAGIAQADSSSEENVNPAQKLIIRFAKSAVDPAVPAGEGTAVTVVAAGKVISIKDPINLDLPEPENLFMTWSADTFSSPMTQVDYSHRQEDSKDRLMGNPNPRVVSYDPQARLFYLSFRDIFEKDFRNADPAKQQILSLRTLLADGRVYDLEIHFQAQGPLPKIELTQLETENDANIVATPSLEQGQVKVIGKQIENPLSRPLALWVNLRPGLQVTAQTYYSVVNDFQKVTVGQMPVGTNGGYEREEPQNNVPVPDETHYYDQTLLKLDRVLAVSSDGKSQVLATDSEGWTKILVQPLEKTNFYYVLSPLYSSNCSLPPTYDWIQVWTYRYHFWNWGTRDHLDYYSSYIRSTPIHTHSVVTGGTLLGSAISSVQWGEAFSPAPGPVTTSNEGIVEPFKHSYGSEPGDATFACNGLIR